MAATLGDVMMKDPFVLKPEQSIFSALELMVFNGYESLYVVDDDRKPVGVLKALPARVEDRRQTVGRVMDPAIETLGLDQTLQDAALLFSSRDFDYMALPVVDETGALAGLVRVKDIVTDLFQVQAGQVRGLTPEAGSVQLAMTRTEQDELDWMGRLEDLGYKCAVTQVGTGAERLGLKLRESAIVAALAHGVIAESRLDKVALSYAVKDIVLQLDMVQPGLGGGYKLAVVRGEGRIAASACGHSGHALATSPEQIFLGVAIL